MYVKEDLKMSSTIVFYSSAEYEKAAQLAAKRYDSHQTIEL